MDSKRKIIELDLNNILPNRFQPRITFDEAGLLELTDSIKTHGVIQPIIVRKLGEKFEIIAGERRYKASLLAGLKTIPAIITDFNDKQSSEIALIENVQRRDLTPIEEAISYKRILDMNYLTQDELAKKLGKTQSTIANKLRLLNLCDEVQEALLENKISERHARSLLKIKNSGQQKLLLDRIIDERLTVRRTDEEIDKMLNEDKKSKFIMSESELNIPTSDIIGDNNTEVLDNNVSSGVDMLYNQATMNIPKIMGEDIQKYEEENTSKPILNNNPVEELHFGFENNNDVNNPGFMDISDIESNAKDIFQKEPARPFFFSEPEPTTPVVPTEPVVQDSIVETPVVEETRTPLINPMFMNNQVEEEVTPAATNTETYNMPVGDGFDFDFVPAETVKTNQVEIPELADLTQINSYSTPVTPEPTTPVVPTEPVVETPIMETPVVEEKPMEIPVVEEQPQIETLSIDDTPVVETPVVEMPMEQPVSDVSVPVEPAPVVETPVEPEPVVETQVEEPKKEEKKSFFDKLKSLVDNKSEKLEEPVVETQIPEVVSTVEEPVVTPMETLEVPVVPTEPVVETPIMETPVVQEQPQEEVLSFDTPVVEAPVEEPIEVLSFGDEPTTVSEPDVITFDNPVVETTTMETPVVEEQPQIETLSFDNTPVVETPVEEPIETLSFDEPTVVSEPEILAFDTPVVETPIMETASVEMPTIENVDVTNEVNEINNITNEYNNYVESIDDTPVVDSTSEVEKLDTIPEDVMNALNNEETTNDVATSLDNIVNGDDDKTMELPDDLAAIVSNPDLTNNFVNNDDTPSVVAEEVQAPVVETNSYEMPFQTILDDVVIPEEPVVETTTMETPVVEEPEVLSFDNPTEEVPNVETTVEDTLVNNEPLMTAVPAEEIEPEPQDEFKVFEPASLPIDDDEPDTKEDLTVPLYTPIYDEPELVEVPVEEDVPVTNMGGAMKVIREATEQLRKLGFIVDTEEFDLENMYQVIFKINK